MTKAFIMLILALIMASCSTDGADNLSVNNLSQSGVGHFEGNSVETDTITDVNYAPLKLSNSNYNLLWLGKSEKETYSPVLYFNFNNTIDSVSNITLSLFTDSTFLGLISDTIYSTISINEKSFLAPLVYVEDTSLALITTTDNPVSKIDKKPYIYKVIYKLPETLYSSFENSTDTTEGNLFTLTINGSKVDTLLGFYKKSSGLYNRSETPFLEISTISKEVVDSVKGTILKKLSLNKYRPYTTSVSYATTATDNGIFVGNRRLDGFGIYDYTQYFNLDNIVNNVFMEFFFKKSETKFYSDTTYSSLFAIHYIKDSYGTKTNVSEDDIRDSIMSNGDSAYFVSVDITKWGINMINDSAFISLQPNMDLPYLFNTEVFDFKIRVEESKYVKPEGQL